ncbi:hypothetical protein BV25DRAFT_1832767 [Artomyces pyxidatus]|uniref:Uncharacterized protein n=1 Tax=Artomyces pyxidatus TaxID=48021 RepID=A0ACB8SHC3_9AGAM|nr:hypothetical protein BV25DRAFT_1832767 [Artomyces pyxidatus]
MSPFKRLKTRGAQAAIGGADASSSSTSAASPAKSKLEEKPGFSAYAESGLTLSLSLLREIGEMSAQVPYVKGVAGIMLRILAIKDEIEVYKSRCAEVIDNVDRVIQVIVSARQYCQEKNIHAKKDMPPDMEELMASIEQNMQEILEVLTQCTSKKKWEQFKLNIVRTDLLRKIERCDRKIKSIIDASTTVLLLNIRINQEPKKVKQIILRITYAGLPPKPEGLFGREEQVEKVATLLVADRHRPARLAFLGSEGVGKTALAVTILHHPRVAETFKDAIYFISCTPCTSLLSLQTDIAKAFGVETEYKMIPVDQKVISCLAASPPCLVCLDGFETPWSQPAAEKIAVESFLARITSLPNVTVLLTMRGLERPAGTAWTRPFLPALTPIDFSAANYTLADISGRWENWGDMVMAAADTQIPNAHILL